LGRDARPLIRNVHLYCKDGDPRRDRDGLCDGQCTVMFCDFEGDYIGGCPFLGGGFCLSSDHASELIPVGQHRGEGLLGDSNFLLRTRFTLHCLRAAPKCDYRLPADRFSGYVR
jgi:hypothetical protein